MATIEEAVPDREQIFYQSFLQSSDAVVICDAEGTLLFVNPAFNTLFGYEEGEVIGKNASILRDPDEPDEIFRRMWARIRNEKIGYWKGELRNRRKDGSSVDVVLAITSIRDTEGKVVAYTGNMLDNSSVKLLEARMIQQEKLTSIGMLAAGMAHQIGTPLNVISGRAEMARAFVGEKEGAIKALDIIIQQTERISSLVQALLKFSRPPDPASRENLEWVNLSDVLNECRNLLDESLKRNNIRLAVTTLDNPRLRWDFVNCEQVFINLLQNAIFAVEDTPRPKIDVVVEMAPPDLLRELEVPAMEGLHVEVRDNGCGISAEDQRHIFDPFFTTKEVGTGTGLGLSVVYGLVQDVNGMVSVTSRPGQGSTFELILPILPD